MAHSIPDMMPFLRLLGRARYTMLLPWLVLAAGLAVTLLLWNNAQQGVMREMQTDFESRMHEAIDSVTLRMKTYEQALRGAAGLFAASGKVGRSEFRTYVDALDIKRNYPGMQGVGFALIVPAGQKDRHVAAIRAEGFREYAILPEGLRDVYTSVVYIEPFNENNQHALGDDMFSDNAYPRSSDPVRGVRRAAMEQARDTGKATLSGKVDLLAGAERYPHGDFMIYLPVYKHGTLHDTVAERRANIVGWVYAPFRMQEMMTGILGEASSDVDIEVFDGRLTDEKTVMYDPDLSAVDYPGSSRSGQRPESLFHDTRRIEIAGHEWTVAVRSLDGFEMRLNGDKPRFIARAGAGASLLLALLTWLLVYGRIRAVQDAREIILSEERLAAVIDTALDAVVEMDVDGVITGWNAKAEKIFGWPRGEVLGRMLHETIIPPRHREVHAMELGHFTKSGRWLVLDSRIEMTGMRRDGSEFPIEVAITQIQVNGNIRFSSFIRDITERKRAEEELRLASLVYENSSEAMSITDADNRILAVNPAFEKMTGYSEAEVIGKSPSMFSSGIHDPAFYQQMWEAINTAGHWQGEIWDKRKNGEVYVQLLTINTTRDGQGNVSRYVALFSDITKKKEFEEAIWKQANFDALTGLPNRRLFGDRLEQELGKNQYAAQSLALMFIDLDRFKEINDTLGHDMGDLLLKEAAQRLSDCVRTSDTVARLGGDEFTVIMAGLDDHDNVEFIAQDILLRLAEPFHLGGEIAYVSASIGITFYPADATTVDALLKNADQAMYVSKNQGRNRYSYYNPAHAGYFACPAGSD